MARVLTTASTVLCGALVPAVPGPPGEPPAEPPLHGGTVTVVPPVPAKLRVQGSPVLVRTSIDLMAVAGCKTPASTSTSPCLSVASLLPAGFALKLTLGGQGVALDTLSGATNGAPPGTVPASAGQSKLTAI